MLLYKCDKERERKKESEEKENVFVQAPYFHQLRL